MNARNKLLLYTQLLIYYSLLKSVDIGVVKATYCIVMTRDGFRNIIQGGGLTEYSLKSGGAYHHEVMVR